MGFQCSAPAANQNAIPVMIPVGTRQRQGKERIGGGAAYTFFGQGTLGKGKLRSPMGGTI